MNPETIRLIDIWAGRIICLFLTLLRRLGTSSAPAEGQNVPVKKILFIKLIEQGATVLAYSAIEKAVKMVGRENVFFCVFEENRAILDILNILPEKNIFAIRHQRFDHFLWDILKLLLQVRRLGIDATVDMEFFARASAILAFMSGARRRVGLHRFTGEGPYRGDLLTHRIHYNPYLHTAKAYHLLVEALAADPADLPLLKEPIDKVEEVAPVFVPSPEEKEKVARLLEKYFGPEPMGPLVLLNPNASDMLPIRKWPTERFVSLGKKILSERQDVRLVITGAPSEAPSAEEVCMQIGSDRAVCLAGKTSLRELLVLYTMADVLVTNDSGPGHFSSMTQIRSIIMYGPETPKLFGPIGGRGRTIYAKLACSPCVNVFNHRFSPCRNNRCMQAISVETVYAAIQNCLAGPLP